MQRLSWLRIACVVLVFCVTLAFSSYNLHFRPYVFDDAFIGFRIAKNLSLGNGLVYNAGERVMTSSTTLYALLNALVWKIFTEHAMTIVLGLNAVWHSLTCCLLFDLVVRTTRARGEANAGAPLWIAGLFAALFYACSNAVGLVATSGMETPFYTFFICLAFALNSYGRVTLAIAFSTIPFLIRPEGCFVAAALMLCLIAERRKIQLVHVAILAAVVVPFLVGLYLYYGVVVPQSVAAKKLLAINRTEEISEFLKAYFFAPKRLPLGFLFFTGLYYCILVNRKLLPFVVWGIMYGSFFTLTTRWWEWYKPPFYMVYSCTISLGIFFWCKILRVKTNRPLWITAGATVLACALILINFNLQCNTLNTAARWYADSASAAPLVAKLIQENSTKDQVVTLEPLGLIGFHAFDRRFEDYPGLCSPAVVASLRKLNRKININLRDYGALQILSDEVKPALFVLRQEEYQINREKGTLEKYRVVGSLPGERVTGRPTVAGPAAFYILRRVEEGAAGQL